MSIRTFFVCICSTILLVSCYNSDLVYRGVEAEDYTDSTLELEIIRLDSLTNFRAISIEDELNSYDSMIEIAKYRKWPQVEQNILRRKGVFYAVRGLDSLALINYHASMDISERIKDSLAFYSTSGNVGNLYQKNNAFEEAKPYVLNAFNYYNSVDHTLLKAGKAYEVSTVYFGLKQLDSALYYAEIGLASKMELPQRLMAYKSDSLYYFLLILDLLEQMDPVSCYKRFVDFRNNTSITDTTFTDYSFAYIQYAKLLANYEPSESKRYYDFYRSIRNLKEAYPEELEMLSKYHERMGQTDSALFFSNLLDEERNEEESSSNLQSIHMTNSYFNLLRDKKIAEANSRWKEYRNLFIIAALLILVVIAVFVGALKVQKNRAAKRTAELNMQIADIQDDINFEELESLVEATEKERNYISRELHDSLGGSLILSSHFSKKLQEDVAKGKDLDKDVLKDLSSTIQTTLTQVRELSNSLIHNTKKEVELRSLVSKLVSRIQSATGIKIDLNIHADTSRLNNNVKTALLRLTQESLNNIVKHAKAKNVNISLVESDKEITLMIEDDGVGFNIKNKNGKGMGLNNMKERIEELNGSFFIDTTPNKGTTIIANVKRHDQQS